MSFKCFYIEYLIQYSLTVHVTVYKNVLDILNIKRNNALNSLNVKKTHMVHIGTAVLQSFRSSNIKI